MLLNCNSCQKKFVVPDSAVTKSGRLVQCGSCGNKWTQYPEVVSLQQVVKKKPTQKKNIVRKNIKKKMLYTEEYLKQKHGLIIKNPEENSVKNSSFNNEETRAFGFYSYMIVLIVLLISMFGILDLTKEIIVFKYPATEMYIVYLYETIEIVRITLTELINQFKN